MVSLPVLTVAVIIVVGMGVGVVLVVVFVVVGEVVMVDSAVDVVAGTVIVLLL